MSRGIRRHDGDDDDLDSAAPATPEPDFVDTRDWIADGPSVWGEPSRGRLEAVGEVLDGVLGRFAGSAGSTLQQVSAAWEAVAGPEWRTARPVRVSDDTLVVEVPDGMIASRLQFDAARVVGGLRSVAGGRVKRLRFRVARK